MHLSTKILGHLGGGVAMVGLFNGIYSIVQGDYIVGLGVTVWNVTIMTIIQTNFKKYNKPKDTQ